MIYIVNEMPSEIRELAIENDLLESCNTNKLIDLFFEQMTIGTAKSMAGTVVLTFPKYDSDPRPNCIIPEIRSYIRDLHAKDYRFPFYYVDENIFGVHRSHIACLSPLESIELLEDGEKFRFPLGRSLLMENYIPGIAGFMQQLEYSEQEIENRVKSVLLGLGVRL